MPGWIYDCWGPVDDFKFRYKYSRRILDKAENISYIFGEPEEVWRPKKTESLLWIFRQMVIGMPYSISTKSVSTICGCGQKGGLGRFVSSCVVCKDSPKGD